MVSPPVNHENHHVTVLGQNCSHYPTPQANSAYHPSGVGKMSISLTAGVMALRSCEDGAWILAAMCGSVGM